MATNKKNEEDEEIKRLQEELINIILERSGVTKKSIYDTAMRKFITHNLDLLTAEEMKRYKGRVLI
ncbi:MAG: hypothetical protein MJZ90_12060 [Bacteroidales bacterium]|nr:hypothetical protein [Bacteroidales bacterium]